ncbi:hypothetical protein EDF78_10180 [Rahnella sp. BIGb0236]|uniref:hypothetical protein n=1 Tax=Rahnella sp. BIGb0236 TaxID=2485117 RepID=UPI00105D74CC|nr:hypothetical protein [Rahnella sp. BIGb0236]TDS97705.1 hypothetical protein EDF78_10180 [Rahnella sp. BIGb0236]
MTDTTDTAALRVEIAELRLKIAKGYDRFIPETKIHIKLLERILDQLEAERQRAAGSEEELHKALHREKAVERKLLAAQAEIAELKGGQVPMAIGDDIIRDANRYRFLRDEDAWGEDSDSWDCDTRTGLISSENLMGGLSPDHFDDAIDARMAASDIPFLNPATAPQKPVGLRQIGSIDHDGGEFAEYFVEFTDSAQVGQAVYVIDSAIEAAGGIVKTEGEQ